MKHQQPRETAPLWVWFAFALMGIGAIAYITGYWLVEEIVTHVKK